MTTTTSTKSVPYASLYIGDLSADVTEPMLFEIFNQVGPVQSVRVCKDIMTRRSLEYAYVNYINSSDAERALDTLNNTLIKGRTCRIMWVQRDPTFRRSGVGNIFIKNLHSIVGHKELYDTFSAFGNIVSCKVEMNEKGESKGYGFVHFEQKEAADLAIRTVDKMVIMDKEVYVGPFIARKDRVRMKNHTWTNVYVKNLPGDFTKEQLYELFSPIGKITSAFVRGYSYSKGEKANPETVSCSFGFINYESHDQAVKAVEQMNGATVGDQTIYCCRAQKKHERQQELTKRVASFRQERLAKYSQTNLYVKNIEEDINDLQFKELFAPHGKILSSTVMRDKNTQQGKGFGFVCYETPEEAQTAINKMHGVIPPGYKKPLYVAIHESKEVRRQKLEVARYSRPYGHQQQPMYPGGLYYHNPYYHQPQQMVRYSNRMPNYAPNYNSGGIAQAPQGKRSTGRPQHVNPRNPVAKHHHPAQQSKPKQVIDIPQLPPVDFTLQSISQLPVETQKIHIGERLYPLIAMFYPDIAGKITGMFLDSPWTLEELYSLLLDGTKLREKVQQAVGVLDKAVVTPSN